MTTRCLVNQGGDAGVTPVVLVCAACRHTWEPDLLDPTGQFAKLHQRAARCVAAGPGSDRSPNPATAEGHRQLHQLLRSTTR
jgi:hypothetical protein